jgi:SpoVK/Ycf46/Vps4 family AAA+-type ATPase
MTLAIQTEAAKVARDFKHDRVTDIHVLLGWLSVPELLVVENREVIRVNLKEKLKRLPDEGLVNASSGSDIAITPRAREYLTVIKTDPSSPEVFDTLLTRSGIDREEVRIEEPAAANDNPLPAAKLPTLEESLAKLDALVGLEDVKERVKQLVAVQKMTEERKKLGLPVESPGLNLVFSGDPGTGKTTVARIVADIYRALGLLKRGHLVEVGRQDLVAEFVGQTAVKTMGKIEEALDGILFIDEAYALAEEGTGGYGAEAVATLVKAMEDKRENLAVIVAGYTEPMLKFIKSNVGLQSRFTKQIYFENYDSNQLTEIFVRMAEDHQIACGEEALKLVRKHLERNATSGANGNGRYVRKLFAQIYENMGVRAMADGVIELHEITEFQPEDIPASLEQHTKRFTLDEALAQLDSLVGLANVKTKIRELVQITSAEAVRDAAAQPVIGHSLNLVFTGDPGTGKTTVARIVANIYQALGVLPRGQLVETGRQDLVASFVGQTAPKVQAKVDEASGGVLFIDEAYSLTNGGFNDFGSEAIATLVQLMENRRGSFAVITAGYKEEMKFFLEANPGLKSRMDNEIFFPNYSKDELVEIFTSIAKGKNIEVTTDVESALRAHFGNNETGGANGNGRYVRKLFEKMYALMATRASAHDFDLGMLSKFEPEDIPAKLHEGKSGAPIGF